VADRISWYQEIMQSDCLFFFFSLLSDHLSPFSWNFIEKNVFSLVWNTESRYTMCVWLVSTVVLSGERLVEIGSAARLRRRSFRLYSRQWDTRIGLVVNRFITRNSWGGLRALSEALVPLFSRQRPCSECVCCPCARLSSCIQYCPVKLEFLSRFYFSPFSQKLFIC
jgi:hypothetical protein